MKMERLAEGDARKRCWLLDFRGLLVGSRTNLPVSIRARMYDPHYRSCVWQRPGIASSTLEGRAAIMRNQPECAVRCNFLPLD
ncbi:MAG: hypothetical protein A2V78_07015 [Betaproteobacteria bacterium RBG_16_64_18]|nr:MAG: hypothetical protein A2V78_07015 [Betaproteobacteria bacterium RBG_16_64_18]